MTGAESLLGPLRAELRELEHRGGGPSGTDVRIAVREAEPDDRRDILRINEGARLYPSFTVDVTRWEPPVTVQVAVDQHRFRFGGRRLRDSVADLAWRAIDRTYLSRQEHLGYLLLTACIEPVCLFTQPERLPLVHAAGVERRGRGYLLSGSGGAGKTTVATRLLTDRGRTRFLTDDVAIIDDAGRVVPYPRRIMTYRYNVDGNPALGRNLRRWQGRGDRLHWALHRSMDPAKMARRRVPAAALFGAGRVARAPVPLEAVFLLGRGRAGPRRELPSAFVERMAGIMTDEEHPAFSAYAFARGPADRATWERRYRAALEQRLELAKTKIYRIGVPSVAAYGAVTDTVAGLMG